MVRTRAQAGPIPSAEDPAPLQIDTSLLHKLEMSFGFLIASGTAQKNIFGAFAELADNARDAEARNVSIDIGQVNGEHVVYFVDDGTGMDVLSAINAFRLGYSERKLQGNKIGMWGYGLKSGSMRLAKDMLLVTKRNNTVSCILMSQTFLEQNMFYLVYLVDLYYNVVNNVPVSDDTEKNRQSLKLILEYTPFKTEVELFEQFRRIPGDSGTALILFNLNLNANGTILDFDSDVTDIRCREVSDCGPQLDAERLSLRAYLSVLYLEPNMRISLRNKVVQTKNYMLDLYWPAYYDVQPPKVKERMKKKMEILRENTRQAQMLVDEAEFEFRGRNFQINVEDRVPARRRVDDKKDLLAECKDREKKAKEDKSKITLKCHFGFNLHARHGRLVDMYRKLPVQRSQRPDMQYLGVLVLVDIPDYVLSPNHTKQAFENVNDLDAIMNVVCERMVHYSNAFKNTKEFTEFGTIRRFWQRCGYNDTQWSSPPSNDKTAESMRFQKLGHSIQCAHCLQWRHIVKNADYVNNGVPDDWVCDMGDGLRCSSRSKPVKIRRLTLNGDNQLPQVVEGDEPRAKNRRIQPPPMRSTTVGYQHGASHTPAPVVDDDQRNQNAIYPSNGAFYDDLFETINWASRGNADILGAVTRQNMFRTIRMIARRVRPENDDQPGPSGLRR